MVVTQGLANNQGLISLTGGTFDTSDNAMTNSGRITGYGTVNTGGLTNSGDVIFTGGTSTVNGAVTNTVTNTIEVRNSDAVFNGQVENFGTFKTTNANVTFTGGYTESGLFLSDPSTQTFMGDLEISESGALVGGVGDVFQVYGDFINKSQQGDLWNTDLSDLAFLSAGGESLHEFYVAGEDMGAKGFANNFGWGSLTLDEQSELCLFDSDEDNEGTALYVSSLLGLDVDGNTITNIYAEKGMYIYYSALDEENAYLNGQTYTLSGMDGSEGGMLIALEISNVPLPASVWMLLIGLFGPVALRKHFSRAQ
jgi:hypothetical protein